jgi:hypothetical protein
VTGAYASYVGVKWLRYGHPAPAVADDVDPLLDQFMPVYDVAERHHIHVAAPAEITFAAACEQDLMALPIVQTIFKAREILLGSEPDTAARPRGLLAFTKSIGWGVLAEVPGREVVMGAVTQPWDVNVVFRPLPPHEFAAFDEPRLREDRLDTARRRDQHRRIDLSHGNTRRHDRCHCASKVPKILVVPVTRHHPDSMGVPQAVEGRCRAARAPGHRWCARLPDSLKETPWMKNLQMFHRTGAFGLAVFVSIWMMRRRETVSSMSSRVA